MQPPSLSQEAGINGSRPIFLASGIFSAMVPEHEAGLSALRAATGGRWGRGMYKSSDFLNAADLGGLHSEARSLVDFLVVLRSQVCPPAAPAPSRVLACLALLCGFPGNNCSASSPLPRWF